MPVNTPNTFHAENAELWQMCRDFVAGAYAVREAGSAYVPRPEGLKETEFSDYVRRGALFNATQRTVDSLVGLVMQKPPQVDLNGSNSLQAFLDYFDGAGSRAEDFARDAVYDVLCVGGGVAVVDTPERPEGIVTRQQEAQSGIRPYVSWYPIESILDWRYGWINGRLELVNLRLAETWTEQVDEFEEKTHEQVRVMDVSEGQARTRIFRKSDKGQWFAFSEAVLIKDNGQPWEYIPAVMFGPIRNEPEKPPILDLVEVNRSHWQNSVDLEHALHFTGQKHLRRLQVRSQGVDVTATLVRAADRVRTEYIDRVNEGGGTGKAHVPSVPGQPPNTDTGQLVGSAGARADGRNRAETFVEAEYAADLELGTDKMSPRPALGPSFDYLKPHILKNIAKALNNG